MAEYKSQGPHRNPQLLTRQSAVEPVEDQPLYLRVGGVLADQIASGVLGPKQRLPSERELADTFRVARMTARKALAMLEAEGLIHSSDRRGYFVSPPRIQYDPSSPVNLMQQLRGQGLLTENIYLGRQVQNAEDWQARIFEVAPGEPLALERSIVSVEGRRVVYSEDFLLLDALPGYADRPYVSPMTQNMQKTYRVFPKVRWFRIRVASLSLVAARHLDVSPVAPGMHIKYAQEFEDRVVMVGHDYWLADALDLKFGDTGI